jgi:uncharacterized protein (DUF362 family)
VNLPSHQKLSRRQFLQSLALAAAGAAAAGCQPAPTLTPTTAPTASATPQPTFTLLPPTPTATPEEPDEARYTEEVVATSTASVPWNPLGTVVIGQQTRYERQAVKATLQTMIETMGGLSWTVPPGGKVALKVSIPPLLQSSAEAYRYGTHPEVVRALGELLLDAGAGQLYIVEALPTPAAYAEWGYEEVAQSLNATLVDLNTPLPSAHYGEVPVGSAALIYEKFTVNRILTEVDVIISLAKMKCHSATGIALAMHNLLGMVPYSQYRQQESDTSPTEFYQDVKTNLPRIIIDLNMAFPLHLALIDGIQSVQGGESDAVPSVQPINPGLLFVGQNPTAVDSIATLAMGFDSLARHPNPPFIRSDNYLNLAYNLGLGTNLPEEIEVLGPAVQDILVPFTPPA